MNIPWFNPFKHDHSRYILAYTQDRFLLGSVGYDDNLPKIGDVVEIDNDEFVVLRFSTIGKDTPCLICAHNGFSKG